MSHKAFPLSFQNLTATYRSRRMAFNLYGFSVGGDFYARFDADKTCFVITQLQSRYSELPHALLSSTEKANLARTSSTGSTAQIQRLWRRCPDPQEWKVTTCAEVYEDRIVLLANVHNGPMWRLFKVSTYSTGMRTLNGVYLVTKHGSFKNLTFPITLNTDHKLISAERPKRYTFIPEKQKEVNRLLRRIQRAVVIRLKMGVIGNESVFKQYQKMRTHIAQPIFTLAQHRTELAVSFLQRATVTETIDTTEFAIVAVAALEYASNPYSVHMAKKHAYTADEFNAALQKTRPRLHLAFGSAHYV